MLDMPVPAPKLKLIFRRVVHHGISKLKVNSHQQPTVKPHNSGKQLIEDNDAERLDKRQQLNNNPHGQRTVHCKQVVLQRQLIIQRRNSPLPVLYC
jgi:hypothetical protein